MKSRDKTAAEIETTMAIVGRLLLAMLGGSLALVVAWIWTGDTRWLWTALILGVSTVVSFVLLGGIFSSLLAEAKGREGR